MIIISHTYLFIQRKWTFVGPCAPSWSIFARKNLPHIDVPTLRLTQWWATFTKLFLSNVMKYDKRNSEWHIGIQGMHLSAFCDYFGKREGSFNSPENLSLAQYLWSLDIPFPNEDREQTSITMFKLLTFIWPFMVRNKVWRHDDLKSYWRECHACLNGIWGCFKCAKHFTTTIIIIIIIISFIRTCIKIHTFQ